MPQRETVAGEAAARSLASNIRRMVCAFRRMRSPFGRHRAQLSSSTFMRCNHTWSMGLLWVDKRQSSTSWNSTIIDGCRISLSNDSRQWT